MSSDMRSVPDLKMKSKVVLVVETI